MILAIEIPIANGILFCSCVITKAITVDFIFPCSTTDGTAGWNFLMLISCCQRFSFHAYITPQRRANSEQRVWEIERNQQQQRGQQQTRLGARAYSPPIIFIRVTTVYNSSRWQELSGASRRLLLLLLLLCHCLVLFCLKLSARSAPRRSCAATLKNEERDREKEIGS